MDGFYESMGRAHAALLQVADRHDDRERGQGTVEYVGLILLIAVVMAGVIKASNGFSDKALPAAIMAKLKAAIGDVKAS